jgi:membrane protein implicated in regulation of membrane protease activity
MSRRLWLVLLVPPAVIACLLSLSILGLILAFLPPVVSWVAFAVLVVALVWFFLVRRRGSVVPGSEFSLLGRQSSKEGLL